MGLEQRKGQAMWLCRKLFWRSYRWLKARLFGREWPIYPELPDKNVNGRRLGWLEMPETPDLPEPRPTMQEGRRIRPLIELNAGTREPFIWERDLKDGEDSE